MEVLLLEGRREGYAVSQCGGTMTVGELIEFLKEYDEDTPIFLNNDNGYTFGTIDEESFSISYEAD